MEKALIDLSASNLRNLLNQEIKLFIDCLDNGTLEELENKKSHLREIFKLLKEKELLEGTPLKWGKNSSNNDRSQGNE